MAQESNGATGMQTPFCFDIGIVGLFSRGEHADLNKFPGAIPDSRPELDNMRLSTHPEKTCRHVTKIRTPEVLHVHAATDATQVYPSVITARTTDVVNVIGRPCISLVEKSESMCKVPFAINPNGNVAGSTDYQAGNRACAYTAPRGAMNKYSSLGIVVKKLAQTLRGKIHISHEALQLLIGQRPASVDALRGLRHFSVGQ